jgi:hypothetical protein
MMSVTNKTKPAVFAVWNAADAKTPCEQ